MPTSADIEYYTRRERQERALAERACNGDGRRVHLEMARRYARMIEDAQDRPRPTLRIGITG